MQTIPTLSELKVTADYFGKDTRRKKLIFFKGYIKDLNYIINHIKPQLENKPFAWHLGEQLNKRDLIDYTRERDLIINNFEELTN